MRRKGGVSPIGGEFAREADKIKRYIGSKGNREGTHQ
jgi:hypothetical protein